MSHAGGLQTKGGARVAAAAHYTGAGALQALDASGY